MRELIEGGRVNARPIVEPDLRRTLYLCELSDRTATFALETVRQLILRLVLEAVANGIWRAHHSAVG